MNTLQVQQAVSREKNGQNSNTKSNRHHGNRGAKVEALIDNYLQIRSAIQDTNERVKVILQKILSFTKVTKSKGLKNDSSISNINTDTDTKETLQTFSLHSSRESNLFFEPNSPTFPGRSSTGFNKLRNQSTGTPTQNTRTTPACKVVQNTVIFNISISTL